MSNDHDIINKRISAELRDAANPIEAMEAMASAVSSLGDRASAREVLKSFDRALSEDESPNEAAPAPAA